MERIPILRMGEFLLVTIQVDMHDRLAMTLQDDLTAAISKNSARGVLIDISYSHIAQDPPLQVELRQRQRCPSCFSQGVMNRLHQLGQRVRLRFAENMLSLFRCLGGLWSMP